MKKRKENIKKEITKYLKEEWKFILTCIIITVFLLCPVDYFITTGGGIINIEDRVVIEESYKSNGSLNLSYVSQLKGNNLTYLLSYLIPTWTREEYSDYLIDEEDNINDLEFRDRLDLENSNSNATYWGYTLANEDVKIESNKIYIVYVFKGFNNKFKVQDELLSINDISYQNAIDYKNYLNTLNAGDTVRVKVLRNKKEKEFDSTIYENNNDKILGVTLKELTKYKTKKKIKFKFKSNESGPSAGLITTLDIYNKLSKEDITKGLKIAGTGTIERDGSIGEIGGIEYKVLGASKKHADIFLTPKGNYKECMKSVKDNNLKIKVISVDTIEDAINKLKK